MFLSFSLFFVQRLVAQASRTDRTNPFSLAWFHSFVVIMTEKEKRPSALMLRRSKTFQLQQSSLRNPSASPKRRQQAFGKMLKGLALRIDSGGNMSAANVHLLKKAMSAPASVYLRPSTPSSPASPLSPMRNRRGTIVLHRLRPVDTKEKKKRYKRLLKSKDLFNSLGDEDINKIIKNLKVRMFPDGGYICRQGDIGSTMYIVEGPGTVLVTKNDPNFDDDETKEVILKELPVGTLFGELALMTDSRRSANIKAKGTTRCMYIDACVFKSLFKEENEESEKKRQQILEGEILEKVSIFSKFLSTEQRAKLLDVLRPRTYAKGEHVCDEGSIGDYFYIIIKGHVKVTVKDPGEVGGERLINRLHSNDYFGEIALLEHGPRAASCIVESESASIMLLHKVHFNIMIPSRVKDMMRQEMELTRIGFGSDNKSASREAFATRDVTQKVHIDSVLFDFCSGDQDFNPLTRSKKQKGTIRKYALRRFKNFVSSLSNRRADYAFLGPLLRTINEKPGVKRRLETFVFPLEKVKSSRERKDIGREIFRKILTKKREARTSQEILFLSQFLLSCGAMETLLQPLSDSQIGDIAQTASYQVVEEGNVTLYNHGDKGNSAYLILSGAIRIVDVARNGVRSLKSALRAGSSFGELACVGVDVRPASAITTMKTELLVIDKHAYIKAKRWQENTHTFMSLTQKTKVLQSSSIFAAWANDMLFQFSFNFVQETFDAGTIILQENTKPTGLYIIVDGTVSVWQSLEQNRRPTARSSYTTSRQIDADEKLREKLDSALPPSVEVGIPTVDSVASGLKPEKKNNGMVFKNRLSSKRHVELSVLGSGQTLGLSLVEQGSSAVECVSYVAKSVVNVLKLPVDIFKSEISELQGAQMKTRHRSTLKLLQNRLGIQKRHTPRQKVEAIRRRKATRKVAEKVDWPALEAEKKFFGVDDWFVELKQHASPNKSMHSSDSAYPPSGGQKRNPMSRKVLRTTLKELKEMDRRAAISNGRAIFKPKTTRYRTYTAYLDDIQKRKKKKSRPKSAYVIRKQKKLVAAMRLSS